MKLLCLRQAGKLVVGGGRVVVLVKLCGRRESFLLNIILVFILSVIGVETPNPADVDLLI